MRVRLALGTAFVLVALGLAIPAGLSYAPYLGQIYDDAGQAPHAPVAIVFGASVRPDGEPSQMLADRVDAAVALYKEGKVDRLLMSGDQRSPNYDEVSAMKRRALAQGVPADRIDLDGSGFRTYDSAYRAKTVFGITEAILVSQRYHLPRALFLANSFGIKAVGVAANRHRYAGQTYSDAREVAALVLAWYDINLIHPRPLADRSKPAVSPG